MPKYLFKASYTTEGVKGVLKEGGVSRRTAIAQLAEGMGGSMEAFYYTMGSDDAIVIVDLPDQETAVATSLAVNASGGATVTTVVLLTAEEVDAAVQKTVNYRPPGK